MVRAIAWLGGAAFWVVQLSLLLVVGMPLMDTVLLAVLLVALPSLAVAQLPMVGQSDIERLPAYWGSIAVLWLLGTACWMVGTRSGGPAALGIVRLAPGPLLVWSIRLTLAGLFTIVAFRQIGIWLSVDESPLLRRLLPRSGEERGVFALLSLLAGVSEEVAYRGYAIPLLAPILGTTGAAVLTSVVFGVLHGYQGALGIVRTAVMGGVLAWGLIASGSLWPPVVAHTVIDLLAGIVWGERLLSPRGPTGVGDSADLRSQQT